MQTDDSGVGERPTDDSAQLGAVAAAAPPPSEIAPVAAAASSGGRSRITSWNINHLYADRYPTMSEFLDSFASDIICFQEVKLPRSRLDSELAVVPGYDAFFATCKTKHGEKGYSGVATYTRSGVATPIHAEEGVAGSDIGGSEAVLREFSAKEIQLFDVEGRVVVTDHELFVLFNLVRQGRNVVIAGDFNICHRPIDHCDPETTSATTKSTRSATPRDENGWTYFSDTANPTPPTPPRPSRSSLTPSATSSPPRRGAFTCWNNLINGRASNFGTRIDLVVVSARLAPWLAAADIDPLADVVRGCGEPPRLCAKYWEEFTGRQASLKKWLTSGSSTSAGAPSTGSDDGDSVAGGLSQSQSSVSSSSQQSSTSTASAQPKAAAVRRTWETPQKPSCRRQEVEKRTRPPERSKRPLASFFAPKTPAAAASNRDSDAAVEEQFAMAEASRESAKAAWKSLMAPPSVPHCYHNEPAKEYQVNNSGPNHGRRFYLCARPVGPSDGRPVDADPDAALAAADDAAKPAVSVTPRREPVQAHEFRCNFFKFKKAATDLWAATKASAAWRRVAESAGQSVWRRSLFSTYYRGNTFAARLPAGDIWPLDIADDDEPPARGRPRPWPASPASPGSGEHAVAAAAAAYTWTGGELPENSRVRTLCEVSTAIGLGMSS
ncbi:Endonuclease/exonuclease/phosphatase [Zopfochytrium polystomum]|nr:Endonuclease/exonuclease/phosphatase [Zopfochytrium polystomum]